MDSVQAWAGMVGAEYRFLDDALFQYLPDGLRHKLLTQKIIATDLARLFWAQAVLDSGADRVIWIDADVLVFDPSALVPADTGHAFGREVWVQGSLSRPKAYRKIHNAYMLFTRGDPVLPFYLHTATRMADKVTLPVVPQFIGPKLLTALHNIADFTVEERVGMISPMAAQDSIKGGGPALDMTLSGHSVRPCAFNLSSSYEDKPDGDICLQSGDFEVVITRLLDGCF